MKQALAAAYASKRSSMKKPMPNGACPDCSPEAKCMAHGGAIENEDLHESEASESMAPHELVDADMSGPEESSVDEKDLPEASESLSLAAQVMKDRKRLKMADGGMVEAAEELDAPEEDGRDSRGLNAEPVHVIEDDEHDQSDASLVSQILKDRKRHRRGM